MNLIPKSTVVTKTIRYYHTLKYLKFSQFYGQIRYRIIKPKASLHKAPQLRQTLANYVEPIQKFSHLLDQNRIMILNQVGDISSTHIWNDIKLEKLWLYNLHYFDCLHASNSSQQNIYLNHFMMRWIN